MLLGLKQITGRKVEDGRRGGREKGSRGENEKGRK
jgi:hypothetical protein